MYNSLKSILDGMKMPIPEEISNLDVTIFSDEKHPDSGTFT